jgi:putative hydrolase of the HAD superfamily
MKKYRHILFDLDGTLWDFEGNSKEAFADIFRDHNLSVSDSDFRKFEAVYHKYNDKLWEMYREGKIEKGVLRWLRFYLTLKEFGIDDKPLAEKMDQQYITISPEKTRLIPNSREILEYLQPKYALHIVTNGFNEVQFTKLRNAGLAGYFYNIITSEMAGHLKPNPEFFRYTLEIIQATESECLMVGDNFQVDIEGAMRIGMDQAFYNPEGEKVATEPTFRIKCLLELKRIL